MKVLELVVGKDNDYLLPELYISYGIHFFDEATSALDANNERTIIENLEHFLKVVQQSLLHTDCLLLSMLIKLLF